MKISRTLGIVIVVGIIAVAGAVGYGFALSPLYGYTYSEDNTTGTSTMTVDVYVDNGSGYVPLSANMPFPAYDSGATVAVSGSYKVYVKQDGANATGAVRLWCIMGSPASWMLIDEMYVVYSGDATHYNFGIAKDNGGNITATGVPTSAVQLTGEVQFTIYVTFTTTNSVIESMDLLNAFTGTKFVFALDESDPLQL